MKVYLILVALCLSIGSRRGCIMADSVVRVGIDLGISTNRVVTATTGERVKDFALNLDKTIMKKLTKL